MVQAILKVELPKNKKEVQSFLGQVNFLKRFISCFAEVVNNITNMLKKDHEIKWIEATRKYFWDIKQAIATAPILINPDFFKEFLNLSYALEHTIVGVLLQKNEKGEEQPMAFYRKTLRDAPLKYDIIDKKNMIQSNH